VASCVLFEFHFHEFNFCVLRHIAQTKGARNFSRFMNKDCWVLFIAPALLSNDDDGRRSLSQSLIRLLLLSSTPSDSYTL
jgi:hypothetical protein